MKPSFASTYEKLSAAQIFVFDTSFDEASLSAYFKEVKKKGVNAVFVRVFQNMGDRYHFSLKSDCLSGVYYKAANACLVEDILPLVIEAAKKYDIKVYAWLATRSLSFLKTKENMSLAFSPDEGFVEGYGASLFKPDVKRAILSLFKDLASYEIDGILIQDDFIIKHNEGAELFAKRYFEFLAGFKLEPEALFSGVKSYNGKKIYYGYTDKFYQWARFKSNYLMKFYKEIETAVKGANPNIKIIMNVYYETPIYFDDALAWYSQNLDAMIGAGIDYIAVMGYVEQIASEKGLSYKETADLIAQIADVSVLKMKNPARVIMKLQSKSFQKSNELIEPKIFSEICKKIRVIKGLSVAVLPINNPNDINAACFF